MRRSPLRAAGLALLALVLALTTAGCGGFGAKQPAAVATTLRSYVALGDGFAAGPYVGSTSGGCLRGTNNYPALVSADLKINTFTDVTCTGADTDALTQPSTEGKTKTKVPAQIDAVQTDTSLVTVTAGIMDHDLIEAMFHTCVALPCGNSISGKFFVDQLKSFGDGFTAALRSIQNKAPQAIIVVVGYPQLMPTTKTCAKLPTMTPPQLSAANAVLTDLNMAMASSARQIGGSFVDVASLTQDHNACSAIPWVNGMTAVTGHSVAFHPTSDEQAAVATAVAAAVRSQ